MGINETFEELLQQFLLFIPKLIAALITFVVSILLSGMASRWVRRSARIKLRDPETLRLVSRIARWSIIALGTLIALDQVNFDVTGFLAGLGIAGVTIGFALQDISRNFVAGILLLVRQPFDIGDAVSVAGYSGTVLDITTRDTVLKTWDGEMVIMPNIDVFTNPITNYSKLPYRRRTVKIGLGYGEDIDRAKALFLETMHSVDGVADEPAPEVLAEEMGDSALAIAARFWVDQTTHGLFDVHSDVVQAITEAAEKEQIDLPYPIQTVRLERQLEE
ncbi:MAG: mechanosensitive ion channel family protein [Anaerolineae bacterium]|jgi:small-conductance mechanosensitive channel